MNLFGLVIGQNILMIGLTLIVLAFSNGLLRRGWPGKILGLLLFAGAAGWLAKIVLYDGARIPVMDLPAPYIIGLLAACYAAFVIHSERNSGKKPFFAGKKLELNKNSVISVILLILVVIVTLGALGQGNWESFFDFDNRAANRAREETTNGILRFINRLLRELDRFLAR